MRPIVQLHDETHWREAVMIDGRWHVSVDGVMQPATKLHVRAWSYMEPQTDPRSWQPLKFKQGGAA